MITADFREENKQDFSKWGCSLAIQSHLKQGLHSQIVPPESSEFTVQFKLLFASPRHIVPNLQSNIHPVQFDCPLKVPNLGRAERMFPTLVTRCKGGRKEAAFPEYLRLFTVLSLPLTACSRRGSCTPLAVYIFRHGKTELPQIKHSALGMFTSNPQSIVFLGGKKKKQWKCQHQLPFENGWDRRWPSPIRTPGVEATSYNVAESLLIKYTKAFVLIHENWTMYCEHLYLERKMTAFLGLKTASPLLQYFEQRRLRKLI